MNFEQMETPRNRREFERNFFIAAELLRNDKMRFTPNVDKSIDGLRKVRLLPNNRIDFLSVDEVARLHVNMMANMSQWEL
ncbi:AVAST type 1 anti-phage system protein Avs1c [Paenibacillus amylolyticus]|uniref:AVAST type 1 anti-phage system protein Avs1c n=1 Tax=Paenibacillus sp. PK1-4R TaxID=3049075 RepID=UPI0025A01956|nr:AVAST type 1 anti-phage system protein Avs1c [Paenibacillus sp. PK1-4R]WJM05900.1 AVAST type 1 anti-phage system protein Avs1c [Paenibacillus sp. PK1-4R]WKL02236.1 AVAST type 1 anti-phage system protein Avs1c [Paenibacillus amylolyticus]